MKKIVELILALLMSVSFTPINAATQDDQGCNVNGSACTESKSYIQSSKVTSHVIDVVITARNDTDTMQTLQYEESRTVSYSGNVSIAAERNLITTKVGLSAEGTYGRTTTVRKSTSVNVPPHTTCYCDFGSASVKSTGQIVTRNVDCSKTTKNVWLQYTYGPYVHWR